MKKIIVCFIAAGLLSCADAKKNTITVFHAGSLTTLMKELEREFEKKHNYTVLLEASGSVDAARKITDLNKRCDVIALADVELFDSMLADYCNYTISFAGNEMVLAYTEKSRYAKAIAADWVDALVNNDVNCARSDPLRDPCGYRTLLVWKLAGKYYNNPQLEKIFEKRSPKKFMRPKEVDCVALLEAGACDALWIYRSIAKRQNFPYVRFNDHINLGNARYDSYYRQACVHLSDAKKEYTFCGSVITYGAGIPVNAVNPQGAVAFLLFLVSAQGQSIIKQHGFNVIAPYSNQWDKLPAPLQKVVARGKHQ